MPFCKKCGFELDEDSQFCVSCGTSVPTTQPDSPEATVRHPVDSETRAMPKHIYGVVNPENLPTGHVVDNRYEIIKKLGQGGIGAVYHVFDRKMKNEKALKVFPESIMNDCEATALISKEASIMVALNHPNIVRVFDFHNEGNIKYIDMEFVDGKSLADIKFEAPEKKLSNTEVKSYAIQIAEGMAYAHTENVIHKDIKPRNILLSKTGIIKIMDFGISETMRPSMSRIVHSNSSGTVVYMSPEQVKGKNVGREADIYSFGATLYELLSGYPPFYKGDITYQILNETPAPIDGVSEYMNTLILKCLAKDYRKRYQSFGEVKKALESEPLKTDKKKAGKKTYVFSGVALLLIAMAAFITFLTTHLKTQLYVNTKPDGARIDLLDSKTAFYQGITLDSGTYNLKISAKGYETKSTQVTLETGEEKHLDIALIKAPPPKTPLYVNATPDNAKIKLLNSKSAFHQGVNLASGIYKLEISAEGYQTETMQITLESGKEKRLDIVLTKMPPAKTQIRLNTSKKKVAKTKKRLTNSIGMTFVYISPDTFVMGSSSNEKDRDSDERKHQVTLTHGFYMQTTEVTQGQWKALMSSNPSSFQICGDDCPVENVSWNDAQEFIQKLNQIENKQYRLPTEAEWEYAARSGSKTSYANGPAKATYCDKDLNLDDMAWYCYNSANKTHLAAKKNANAWGLYDMHGNVWEWCQDWYGVYPSSAVTDPTGPSTGTYRVLRGGSWNDYARFCRSAERFRDGPGNKDGNGGFRLVLQSGQR